MKTILALALILISAGAVRSQTLSPVIQSCGKKCSGEFSVKNNGLKAMFVTLEPKSMALHPDGTETVTPLEPSSGTILVLSETSARVSPMAEHRFTYKLQCAQYPCAVQIFASMIVGKTTSGLQVRLLIPETVYSCEYKADQCRATFRERAGIAKGQ